MWAAGTFVPSLGALSFVGPVISGVGDWSGAVSPAPSAPAPASPAPSPAPAVLPTVTPSPTATRTTRTPAASVTPTRTPAALQLRLSAPLAGPLQAGWSFDVHVELWETYLGARSNVPAVVTATVQVGPDGNAAVLSGVPDVSRPLVGGKAWLVLTLSTACRACVLTVRADVALERALGIAPLEIAPFDVAGHVESVGVHPASPVPVGTWVTVVFDGTGLDGRCVAWRRVCTG